MRSCYAVGIFVLAIGSCAAQPFEPREPFGEPYGFQWNLVLNQGQIFDLGNNSRSDVVIASVGTTPSLYLFDNSRTGFTYRDPVTGMVSRIDLTFVGENSQGVAPGLYHQTGMRYNFYEENTPGGVTGLEAGKHAIFEDVYPKIDFHVLSNPWDPKFYIVLRPGADPADLRMEVSGHDSLRIDLTGELRIWFENKFLLLDEGYAYQQIGNTIVNVSWLAHYENVDGSANVTFDLGTYDHHLPLILCIKPWLPPAPPPPPVQQPEWSTYFPGNTQDDFINDLTHDDDGYVYFTGSSKSTNGLPISAGAEQFNLAGQQDVVVGRINSNYEITTSDTWMTYYGGSDTDRGVAVDYTSGEGGRLAVCGPSASGADLDNMVMGTSWNITGYNFLALFNPADGTRMYGTRLPHMWPPTFDGSGPVDLDYDTDGNLYMVGYGDLTNNAFNQYVTGPAGSADYTSASYLNFDSDLLHHDGYVARFDPGMHLTWLTALGGPNDERVFACAVDNALHRLVVVGNTATKNNPNVTDCPASGQYEFPLCFPTVGNAWRKYLLNGSDNCDIPDVCGTDGFVTVFALNDLHILYSSYFGSGHGTVDAVTDVVTDSGGNIYLTGWSDDGGEAALACQWVDTDPAWVDCDADGYMNDSPDGGFYNHFIARLNGIFEETWSTRIEGDQYEYYALLNQLSRPRLAVDYADNVYMYGSTASGAVPGTTPIAPFVPNGSYYSNEVHADPDGTTPAEVYDTYVLKFDPTTDLLLSTLVGGPGQDYAASITAVGDRIYVSGATSSPLFPTHAPTISGATPYLVTTPSTATGDLDAFMAQLGFDITIGFREDVGQPLSGIRLFPNPTTSALSISGLEDKTNGRIEIVDILGQPVMEPVRIITATMSVDMEHLSPGSYVVRTVSLNGMRTGRFVKQ